jgi:hypothetical protein
LVAAIHMLWDWDALVSFGQIRMFILILVTWITIFVMIHAGLREVKALQLSVKNDSEVTERG